MRDHYKTLGVATQRERRRDQEGLPQARARDAPRQASGRSGGRGAVQADRGRPTRSLSDPEKRKQYDLLGEAGMRGARRRRLRPALRDFNQDGIDISDLLGGIFGRGGGGGARARPRRRARPRPRGRRDDLVPRQPERRARLDRRSRRGAPAPTATAPARRRARARSTCPECEGRGVRAQAQGFFSLSQPCLRCGGTGHVDRAPLPELRRARLDAAPAPLRRADPGRHQGRRAHPAARQGRGGLARRARRRPLRAGLGRALAGVHAARRRPRSSTCP